PCVRLSHRPPRRSRVRGHRLPSGARRDRERLPCADRRRRVMSALAETAKVSAFVRRDLRIMLSYRMAAFGELAGMAGQAIAFSFVARLIDPSRLPIYGSAHADYLEFVVVGIAMNMVVIMMLHQLATAI